MAAFDLFGMDTSSFEDVVEAFQAARDGDPEPLKSKAREIDFPGYTIDEVLADLEGETAGRAFAHLVHETCRGDEHLSECDIAEARDALARLLTSEANGADSEAVAQLMPPHYDGTQEASGNLGALALMSQIVHRGSPWSNCPIAFTILNPEVPELFGELSPTEVKYDDSPEASTVRRFYDFVEAMMIIGEGGYQIDPAAAVGEGQS